MEQNKSGAKWHAATPQLLIGIAPDGTELAKIKGGGSGEFYCCPICAGDLFRRWRYSSFLVLICDGCRKHYRFAVRGQFTRTQTLEIKTSC